MALSSLVWDLHPHPLLPGQGAASKLEPWSSFLPWTMLTRAQAQLALFLDRPWTILQLCLGCISWMHLVHGFALCGIVWTSAHPDQVLWDFSLVSKGHCHHPWLLSLPLLWMHPCSGCFLTLSSKQRLFKTLFLWRQSEFKTMLWDSLWNTNTTKKHKTS